MAAKIDKETQKYILEQIDAGIPLQEIYNEQSPKYYDKKALAEVITRTVPSENKKQYKNWNYVLIGLLFLPSIILLFVFGRVLFERQEIGMLIIAIIAISIVFLMIINIFRYNAAYYPVISVFLGFSYLRSSSVLENDSEMMFFLFYTISTALFSIFLYYKLFPNYKRSGYPVDENGEYILSKNN